VPLTVGGGLFRAVQQWLSAGHPGLSVYQKPCLALRKAYPDDIVALDGRPAKMGQSVAKPASGRMARRYPFIGDKESI